jgi:MFS family permease
LDPFSDESSLLEINGVCNSVRATTSNLRVPRAVAATIDALNFSAPRFEALTDSEWHQALGYCDRNQLTLILRSVAESAAFPEWVRERLDRNAKQNRERFAQALQLYHDLRTRFEQEGLEHLVLKGFAQWPYLAPDPTLRPQYDLDLFFLQETVRRAQDVVATFAYEPLPSVDHLPTDHLPTMIRKTGWQWRGNYFDPEIPLAIELHYRFWSPATERFGPSRLEEFWGRREGRVLEDQPFLSLCAADSLAYTCLHGLRHLLRGDTRPVNFYEIAWYLHNNNAISLGQHDECLRRIKAICFGLANMWFGCRLVPEAQEEVGRLPAAVKQWIARFGFAPLESPFSPNKNEVWLHLALLKSVRDKAAVLRRRLVPLSIPGQFGTVHLPESEVTWAIRVNAWWRYLAHLVKRFVHHSRTLIALALAAPSWWATSSELTARLWLFLGCAALFNFGIFLFFLLYNLYLLDRGHAEDFVGWVTGMATAGSIAGSLIGGALVSRTGLRASLMVGFSSTALVSALRVWAPTREWLLATAFLAGLATCIWFVCVPLVVAQLTTERNRPVVFSLTLGSGISMGILAGLAGGRLPGLFGSKEFVLLLGCGLALLAVIPLAWLRLEKAKPGRRTFSRHPFLLRFLVMLALWSLATGAFNPFFNVYFSRTFNTPVEQIGSIFSISQFCQVSAILLAPLLFRKFGLNSAVAMTQAATACALMGLGLTPAAAAGFLYTGYMSFQYMGEPGMYSLLMNRLPVEERTGAASLNFFVIFGTNAVAASVAGMVITRFGYPPLLVAAAALALLAALLVRFSLREPVPPSSGPDTT